MVSPSLRGKTQAFARVMQSGAEVEFTLFIFGATFHRRQNEVSREAHWLDRRVRTAKPLLHHHCHSRCASGRVRIQLRFRSCKSGQWTIGGVIVD